MIFPTIRPSILSTLRSSVASTGLADYLLDLYGGASAAYSLRKLNGLYSGSVIRVRRESDNAERDFTAQDINTSVVENWVNQQIIPPLDLRELTPTGRDGPLIEAAAAYSLRSLGTNQWSYGGDTVTYTSDFSAGIDGWSNSNATASSVADPVDAGNVMKVTVDTSLNQHYVQGGPIFNNNTYSVSTQVYVPSSNSLLNGIMTYYNGGGLRRDYPNIATDQWVTLTSSGTVSSGQTLSVRGLSGADYNFQGNGTDVFYIRNVVISETLGDSNYLPAGKYVTQVRRSSDNQVRSFTAVEVSDGTLLAWVGAGGTDNGHVTTWYDQSGNTKHATQGTPASQPKVVDAGSLVELGLDFTDGKLLNFSSISAQTVVSVNQLTSTANFSVLVGRSSLGGGVRTDPSTGIFRGADTPPGGNSDDFNGAGGSTYVNGAQSSFDATVKNVYFGTANAGYNLTSISTSFASPATRAWKGKIAEVIIYNSDQSDNRTAFEANIGEVYGIAGIPAYDNTVNGFVETWYDQSGNGNDASQLTASNQPKIVDTGVLVLSNGNAAIKSTASNEMSFSMASLSADGQQSVFGVLENDVTSQDGYTTAFRVYSSSTGTNGENRRPNWFIDPNGSLVFSANSQFGYTNADRDRRLYSHIMEDTAGGTSTVYQDGTQVDTRSITLDANPVFSFARVGDVGINAVGALYTSEMIYYPSDESANRAAIEDNIDNHYGITSAGSYVNAAGDSYINAAGDTYLQP